MENERPEKYRKTDLFPEHSTCKERESLFSETGTTWLQISAASTAKIHHLHFDSLMDIAPVIN